MYLLEKHCIDKKPELLGGSVNKHVPLKFAKTQANKMLEENSVGGIPNGKVMVSDDETNVYYRTSTGELICSWVLKKIDVIGEC